MRFPASSAAAGGAEAAPAIIAHAVSQPFVAPSRAVSRPSTAGPAPFTAARWKAGMKASRHMTAVNMTRSLLRAAGEAGWEWLGVWLELARAVQHAVRASCEMNQC